MKGKNNKKSTRQYKEEEYFTPTNFEVMTQKQSEYKHEIYTKNYVIATGRAGTGKTYVACRLAARLLKQEQIKKIILCRPAVSDSQTIGLFKGTKEEKMYEWIRPMLGALTEDFPNGQIQYMLKVGILDFVPLETIKGHSFKDAFVVIDEAEDIKVSELKKIMTRLGENSTMVFCGDTSQVDIKQNSGLAKAIEMREKYPNFRARVGWIDFDEKEDIVRSEAVADVIYDFEAENI
ncbi:PhoH-like protein [Vibrio phage Phriendly]|nr:PhoH-like protein [Vibrio phage Phriendly]